MTTWRALKTGMNKCGCETDDDSLSDEHIELSPEQSAGDRGRNHHYPVGTGPKTWCIQHRAERPCVCDEKQKAVKQSSPTKTKGKR